MRVPENIFIDTSIFEGQQYDFESREFLAFKKHFRGNSISVLMPDPTKREIVRHIKEKASSAAQAVKSVQQKASFVRRIESWPLHTQTKEAMEDSIRTSAMTALSQFLNTYNAIDLDYSGISIDQIMDNYDLAVPPFGDGKKRKEFPDAFAVASLDAYHSKTGKLIAVIAKDSDLLNSCELRPHLIYYESLSAFVEAAKFEEQKIVQIDELIENDSSLQDAIGELFTELGFIIDEDFNGEVNDVGVSGVELSEIRLSEIRDKDFMVSFRGRVYFSADLYYDDYDTAIYDSEDKVLIPIDTIDKSIDDDVFVSGSARLVVNDDWESISMIADLSIDQDTFTLRANEDNNYH